MTAADSVEQAPDHDCSAVQLRARPGVQRVPSPMLELFVIRRFLDGAACARLMALIDRDRRPSPIADPNGDPHFRTSETCYLHPGEPDVDALEARLGVLSGISPRCGEPLQGQRYAEGQEFKPHTDYFDPAGADFAHHTRIGGQRTWTFMIYLNEPEAGGATRFRMIDKTFQPAIGKLLAWNNRRPDGWPNPVTLHHGMKVRKGTKYVITKWYRERPWEV